MRASCGLPPQPLQGTPLGHWVSGPRHLRQRLSRGLSAQHAQHGDGSSAAATVGCACPCCSGGGVALFLRERCTSGEGLMHVEGSGAAAWGGALHASWPQGSAESGGGGGGATKERRGGGGRGGGVAGGNPRGPWAVYEYDNEHDALSGSSGGEEEDEED